MRKTKTLRTGHGLVECPRWHQDALWFADWTSGEIMVLETDGGVRAAAAAKAPPLSFDFNPAGEMFVVEAGASRLLRA